jgi:cation-transporting ATPase E
VDQGEELLADTGLLEVRDARGLSDAEAAERRAKGLGNDVPETHTRSVVEIVRSNVFTPFNFLLGGLLAVILVVGPLQDALFGLVLIANGVTGIVQELRAKRTLDRLTVLTAPKARILRSGVPREARAPEVVLDDVLEIKPGDQIVVDGVVIGSNGLEIDESLVTGESEPVEKGPGEELLSGSFVAVGSGTFRATRVGKEAYARKLADAARRFTLAHSELRSGLNQIIKLVGWAMLPTAALLLYSQVTAHAGVTDALRHTVAGVVAMVPEGLVLLTSVAFAVGVVRLARRQVLVQELPAVEALARVDIVCLDKTGTITSGQISVVDVIVFGAPEREASALGALAASDPNPNSTLAAIGREYGAPDWTSVETLPFSSARKWGATDFGVDGVWLLGAPEILAPDDPIVARAVERESSAGRRVVLLARYAGRIVGESLVPRAVEPRALVVLEDQIRPDAHETLRYFAEEGVTIKIISGDHPRTVSSVAARAGVPYAENWVDARGLPDDPEGLADALDDATAFGRVVPHQKRAMVDALQRRGHVVAMTGDGVNDVLALKDADIGIAMGSGSSATRGAAQLVLLDDSFAALPRAVAEGRRVINNIERVANLFLTKTVYSMLLAIAIGVAGLPFPFVPRHLTLIGSLTIGIPAFFLALAPNHERARPGFVPRVLRFALPVGALAAAATFIGYYLAGFEPDVSRMEARTTATLVLAGVGLLVMVRLARPLTKGRRFIIAGIVAAFGLVLATPGLGHFFALEMPPTIVVLAAVGLVALSGLVIAAVAAAVTWWTGRPRIQRFQRPSA